MILHIDTKHHLSIDSKELAKIKGEFEELINEDQLDPLDEVNFVLLKLCKTASIMVETAKLDFEAKLYNKIYKNL